MTAASRPDYQNVDDAVLAGLVAVRDPAAVRLVTTRNNQRLFRAAFAILGDRAEAEDAVQTAYLRAFAAIRSFEGRSSLSTWLTRIAINEALGRLRAAKRRRAQLDEASVVVLDDYREKLMQGSMSGAAPDKAQARAELRRISIRVNQFGSLSLPPRIERMMFITLSARSGKCSSSQARNRGATSNGSRTGQEEGADAPASAAAATMSSSSWSVIPGMTGAIATLAGTPASLSALTAASRLSPDGARGSRVREIAGVSEVTDKATLISPSAAIGAMMSRSRSTRSDLVVMVTGCFVSSAPRGSSG
jgi:RNA polymerase sigma factor (sigma-70 family)